MASVRPTQPAHVGEDVALGGQGRIGEQAGDQRALVDERDRPVAELGKVIGLRPAERHLLELEHGLAGQAIVGARAQKDDALPPHAPQLGRKAGVALEHGPAHGRQPRQGVEELFAVCHQAAHILRGLVEAGKGARLRHADLIGLGDDDGHVGPPGQGAFAPAGEAEHRLPPLALPVDGPERLARLARAGDGDQEHLGRRVVG
jgi:hypothetical protein